ncbi:hypothetical protein ANCCAN_23658 [Ancylostoma caninum]|uniref:DUF4773 domain-containing protein n=1 Tax=Ancylostoma caninum TaxID=29170 RepID=A0A368FHV1_ANCCA|nr:hypothetical protein ANCCAN_23658 [Ancylostoma caninum]
MFIFLILFIFVAAAKSERIASLKFSIYPSKVNLGGVLPIDIYEFYDGSEQIHHKVNSIAIQHHDHLRGFAIFHNVSDSLALIHLNHEDLDQDTFAISMKGRKTSQLKISTGQLRINMELSSIPVRYLNILSDDKNSCSCVKGNCACCASIKIPDFHHDFCVNATYNRKTIGLDLSIGIDGHYYTQEISVRNPPPICLSVPYVHDIAGICVAFKDLDISKEKRTLSGCIELEVEVIHMRVVHLRLGCFVMPI